MKIQVTLYRYQKVYKQVGSPKQWCMNCKYYVNIKQPVVEYLERMLDTSKS